MHRHASQTLSPRRWLLALLLVSIAATIGCRNRETQPGDSWQFDVPPSDQRAPDVSGTLPDAAPDVDVSPCTLPKDASLPHGEHPWPVRAGGYGRRSQSPHPLPWPPSVGETFVPTFPGDNVGRATELRVDRRGRIHYVRLGSTGSSIVRLDPANSATERLAKGVAADSIRRDSLALAGHRVFALNKLATGKTDELIGGIAGEPWQASSFEASNSSTALLPSTGSSSGVDVVSGPTLRGFDTNLRGLLTIIDVDSGERRELRLQKRIGSPAPSQSPDAIRGPLAVGPAGQLYVVAQGARKDSHYSPPTIFEIVDGH